MSITQNLVSIKNIPCYIRLKIIGASLKVCLFTFYGNILHNHRIFLHVINNI